MERESLIKKKLKKSFLYKMLSSYRKTKAARALATRNKQILKEWNENGRPVPPPHIHKIAVVQQYANEFHTDVLIETGTYIGETITACKSIFKKLISIELDRKLYENACRIFADEKHIFIYQGDSGQLLQNILADINEPCLFWLDGHYSEGFTAKGDLNTPIVNELKHIFYHQIKSHVILIDDARCFTGKDDYPDLNTLQSMVKDHDPSLQFSMSDDIIRIHK